MYGCGMTATQPPAEIFDFDLRPGDHFTPDRGDAFLTSRWIPVRVPWLAQATIVSIDGDHVRWTERWGRFSVDVLLERTDPRTMTLRTSNARFGRLRLASVNWPYGVDGAGRNLLLLTTALGDMLSVVRQDGMRIEFHLRVHWGIAVHKVGVISRRS